jgi:hypothetical protein
MEEREQGSNAKKVTKKAYDEKEWLERFTKKDDADKKKKAAY